MTLSVFRIIKRHEVGWLKIGMSRLVHRYIVTDDSKDFSLFIYTLEQSKKRSLLLQNLSKCWPVDTAEHLPEDYPSARPLC